MKNCTTTVTLGADRDAVFHFLANLQHLPRWAPEFCRGLRREGGYWRAMTPGGEDYVTIEPDSNTGVIDLFVGVRPDEMSLLPLRVVRQPHGSAVLCTFFQPAGWSEEVSEKYHEALLAGVRRLAERFNGGEVSGLAGSAGRFHPSLVTGRFYETWDFYTAHLGFRTVCENDLYVHLVHPGGAQLGVLRQELDGLQPELVSATDGRGFWLTLEVPDADAEYRRLSDAGVTIVEDVEDKPWGQRQFIVRDPNGILIAIAHRHPAAAESLARLPAAS